MNTLDIRYLLTGTPIRMRYVNRWSTSRVSFPENVAEHSYFVCLYSMMVARWLCYKSSGAHVAGDEAQNAFLGMVLQRAILHDIEEARTGDIHRPFKYSDPRLRDAMKLASVVAAEQTLRPLNPSDPEEQDALMGIWSHAKDFKHAGRIVSFADYLCVLAFINQEGQDVVKTLCLETLPSHAKEFDGPDYDFIRPLVQQAQEFLKEIFDAKA